MMKFSIPLFYLVASLAFASEPESLASSCAEQLVALTRQKKLVLDSAMGLLVLKSYDPGRDELQVWPADHHRGFRFSAGDSFEKNHAAFKIMNASRRNLAELGTEESKSIVRDRTARVTGLKRAGLFFASAELILRMQSPDVSPVWREKIWPGIVSALGAKYPKLAMYEPGLEVTMAIMADPTLTSAEGRFTLAAIREVYLQTGEDLVLSGLLANYAQYEKRWYFRTWQFDETLRLQNTYRAYSWIQTNGKVLKNFLPQDVDHFVRSMLWRNSKKLFKLEDGSRSSKDARRVGILISRKEIPAFVPKPCPGASKWRKIYEVVDTVSPASRDIADRDVVVTLAPGATEYVVEEARRKFFDEGALSVLIETEP